MYYSIVAKRQPLDDGGKAERVKWVVEDEDPTTAAQRYMAQNPDDEIVSCSLTSIKEIAGYAQEGNKWYLVKVKGLSVDEKMREKVMTYNMLFSARTIQDCMREATEHMEQGYGMEIIKMEEQAIERVQES